MPQGWRRNNNRQFYYYQLISGLTEFYWPLVVNFNFSFSIGFSCRADTATISAPRQASNVTNKPMTTHHKLWTLIFLTLLLACKNQTDRASSTQTEVSDCKPYFSYDQVEHYYFDITEESIWKIEEKEKKSEKEEKQLELLIQYTPDKISDTIALQDIDKIGFVKQKIAENKFEKLNQIFCERKHKEAIAMACIAIYRDILVFKKNGKIIGTAKICFDCDQNVITGTTKNTEDFGQSGDYGKLYRLLH